MAADNIDEFIQVVGEQLGKGVRSMSMDLVNLYSFASAMKDLITEKNKEIQQLKESNNQKDKKIHQLESVSASNLAFGRTDDSSNFASSFAFSSNNSNNSSSFSVTKPQVASTSTLNTSISSINPVTSAYSLVGKYVPSNLKAVQTPASGYKCLLAAVTWVIYYYKFHANFNELHDLIDDVIKISNFKENPTHDMWALEDAETASVIKKICDRYKITLHVVLNSVVQMSIGQGYINCYIQLNNAHFSGLLPIGAININDNTVKFFNDAWNDTVEAIFRRSGQTDIADNISTLEQNKQTDLELAQKISEEWNSSTYALTSTCTSTSTLTSTLTSTSTSISNQVSDVADEEILLFSQLNSLPFDTNTDEELAQSLSEDWNSSEYQNQNQNCIIDTYVTRVTDTTPTNSTFREFAQNGATSYSMSEKDASSLYDW